MCILGPVALVNPGHCRTLLPCVGQRELQNSLQSESWRVPTIFILAGSIFCQLQPTPRPPPSVCSRRQMSAG